MKVLSSDQKNSLLKDLAEEKPVLWINEARQSIRTARKDIPFTETDILEAEKRFHRFSPVLMSLFPELSPSSGIIESEIIPLSNLRGTLYGGSQFPVKGSIWIKSDHGLPIAGSVKARGGIYAVLKIAEEIALSSRILENKETDYRTLLSPAAKSTFRTKTISVASTGNLGLSIGIIGAALGFQITVHMSTEAKEWKKKRLRDIGIQLIEHKEDYTEACRHARSEALLSEDIYFIDDENSTDLFMGYSVSAIHLKKQLELSGILADSEHPLFIYIPCGVGGAPGGITFGSRLFIGDHVHCFFAEPCQAPCMLLGMATHLYSDTSVYDIGLKLKTDADGLAVSRPSHLVGPLMNSLLSGIYTVPDSELYISLLALYNNAKIEIEPSAAAGLKGPLMLFNTQEGQDYLSKYSLSSLMDKATHMIWTTGGSLVPPHQHQAYRSIAKEIDTP